MDLGSRYLGLWRTPLVERCCW